MLYRFIDNQGSFRVKNPQNYNLYFPLTDKDGQLLSSISPNLAGDIKSDNARFLTPPASSVDLKTNLLCRRDFFIKLKSQHKTLRLSYPHNDTLEAGFLYHKLIKKSGFLQVEILNFIPFNLPAEVMWVRIKNRGKKITTITPTSFIPLYGRGEKNLRDHRHVSSLLNRVRLSKYGLDLRPTLIFDERGHRKNKTVYFFRGFEGKLKPPIGQFPTLDYFCGKGDLSRPEAITGNVMPAARNKPEFNGKEALGALRFKDKTLKQNEAVDYFLVMGIDTTAGKTIPKIFGRLNSPFKIKQSLKQTKAYWQKTLSRIDFDFKDHNFNNWLRWVKLQPVLRKLFGCSFLPHFDYGKGGRGWRDLWQDALALLFTEPAAAKKLILTSFAGVRVDGTNATIITKNGEFISDRNKIPRVWMDHGVWPYLTLRLYLNKTGDLNILNKNTGYFQDHLFKRAQETSSAFNFKDLRLRSQNGRVCTGSTLEHLLVQHLTSFFNVGKHNIIRLENADWNDGLDSAYAKGESVTFSFIYAHNLKDLSCFLKQLAKKQKTVLLAAELLLLLDTIGSPLNYADFRQKQKRLKHYLDKTADLSGKKLPVRIEALIRDLEKKSQHLSEWLQKKEWLKEGFFNGYYDCRGKRVEGEVNGKIRILLPSQVFALLSGVAQADQVKKIWDAINKRLWDKQCGGFRLNTDFRPLYLDLGRAFAFSYGDKENGAFFNHMTVLLAKALYACGLTKEAGSVLASVYQMAVSRRAEIYPVIPEYFDNQGKGLYLYLTGSASWYIYTLIEEVLGLKFVRGDLIIEPKLTAANFFKQAIEARCPVGNKDLIVSFIKQTEKSGVYKIKTAFLNNRRLPASNCQCRIKRELLRQATKPIRVKICLA